MKTYEQERNSFIEEYGDLIDEYNTETGTILEDELSDAFKNIQIKRPKISPSSFFREVKAVLRNMQGQYDDLDIPSFVQNTLSGDGKNQSLLQSYFDDVKYVYENLPDGELEFTEANREAILNSNLKMVISTAKRYRNRGLSLEDLIGAGNVGLCVAWDRYKPERNTLRSKILEELEESPDELSREYIITLLSPLVKYGDIKEKFEKNFKTQRVYTKAEVLKWIKSNVKKAKFSSVAALWIRAYILQELNSNSRIVKKPKSEIDKDLELTGSYIKENVVSLDPLIDDDESKNNVISKVHVSSVDDTEDNIDEHEDMISFKIELNKLLEGVNNRDRRILFKSFGIGLPRSMEPREIADSEDLSVARVSQIIQDCITKMKKNAEGKSMQDLLKYLR